MQEEIEEKAVRFAITTTKLSVRTIVAGVKAYLKHRQKKQLRTFERIAKKYGVDFAVIKDTSEKPPVFTAFFKARDTDAMEAVVNEYSKKMVKKQERPSVLAKLRKFIEIAKKQPNKAKNRTQEMTR